MTVGPTPSQTIGPFFSFGMAWLHGRELVPAGSPGAIWITGQVLDGDGASIPDAMIEIFQPDVDGGFVAPWRGFGRCLTDEDGRYRFVTIKPGRLGGGQAPHIAMSVFARGLLQRVMTRLYFPDEAAANAADPVMRSLDDAERAATLVAVPEADGLRFDIRMQGDGETTFFAW